MGRRADRTNARLETPTTHTIPLRRTRCQTSRACAGSLGWCADHELHPSSQAFRGGPAADRDVLPQAATIRWGHPQDAKMRVQAQDRSCRPGECLYQLTAEEPPDVLLDSTAHIVARREVSHPRRLQVTSFGSRPKLRRLRASTRGHAFQPTTEPLPPHPGRSHAPPPDSIPPEPPPRAGKRLGRVKDQVKPFRWRCGCMPGACRCGRSGRRSAVLIRAWRPRLIVDTP